MFRLRELYREFSLAQKRCLGLRLACAAIWTAELFWIQKISFSTVPWIRYPLVVEGIRLLLDASFTIGLVLLLRKRWLIGVQALNLLLLSLLSAYLSHFHRPLMLSRLYYELHEAWSLRGHFGEHLFLGTPFVLMVACAVKVALLLSSGEWPFRKGFRPRVAAVALLMYCLPVFALQFTHLRLTIHPLGGLGRNVFAYGYTLPWFCDLVANRTLNEHSRKAARLLNLHFDRISPLEAPLEIPAGLLILQLESVGGAAVDAQWDNRRIMPFLHNLKAQSMAFRLLAFHYNGSCDMDYAATTFVKPYAGVVPYRLRGLKYTNALPSFMRAHGFKSYVFHGNTAIFYDRGSVLEQLGFNGFFFKEQLEGRGLRSSMIGFRDDEVFRCVLDQIKAEKKSCVFAITLDTHFPFKQLQPEEMEVFPQPGNEAERYLNSLRYLDTCLHSLISQLPPNTTVLMYGDHTASIISSQFRSDVVNGNEYVACLIYQKGADLASLQKTRDLPMAQDGSLNLLDIMSYLRLSIEKGEKNLALQPTAKN
jgi:hypothetical protein